MVTKEDRGHKRTQKMANHVNVLRDLVHPAAVSPQPFVHTSAFKSCL